jgi:uncharacterized protein YigE (DUF2233 family)
MLELCQMRFTILPILLFSQILLSSASFGQVFDPNQITMHWLDEEKHPLLTFDNVRKINPELVFLTNGGKFNARHEPIGLYIENGKQFKSVQIEQNSKRLPAIQGDGVFYIKSGKACVELLKPNLKTSDMTYALQSSPMLVINAKMNPRLSIKERILMRNGVGITKEGKVYFACMEASERSFANHFIEAGCTQALQLDAEVSRVWHKNIKEKVYGRFGVMIGAK